MNFKAATLTLLASTASAFNPQSSLTGNGAPAVRSAHPSPLRPENSPLLSKLEDAGSSNPFAKQVTMAAGGMNMVAGGAQAEEYYEGKFARVFHCSCVRAWGIFFLGRVWCVGRTHHVLGVRVRKNGFLMLAHGSVGEKS